MEPLFTRYMFVSMIYGSIRKTYQLIDAKYGRDKDNNMLPMLWGDKILIIGASTSMSWIFSPMWLLNDINDIHRLLYNIPERKSYLHKYDLSILDYVIN